MTDEKNKIIIADDSKDQRDLHKYFVPDEFLGFDLEFFEDGTSLEKRLNGNTDNVRLVITDDKMPGITGSEIIKKYATRLKFREIPFILYYRGDEEIGKEAVENGAFGYSLKTGDIENYLRTINRALNR